MHRRAFVLTLSLAFLGGLPLHARGQSPAAGTWQGAITMMGQQLEIVVALAEGATGMSGTIDIPMQGARKLPLTNVRAAGVRVHFELPAGPGLAIFDGEIQGDRIAGTFEQAGMKGTFELKRGRAPLPEPPPPYREEDVAVASGSLKLAGTLSLPPTGGPHPAVILITGSGAQNRDEDVFGFKVFKLLADHLTRGGFAVLRCDDRGVGGSTGSTVASTTSDFADDVTAQVAYLRGRSDIDGARIGLLGHSEGGVVAPMVAGRTPHVAFVVLMSAPALPGARIMLAQAELIGRAEGQTSEAIRANAEVQQVLFDAARRNQNWSEARAAVAAAARRAIEAMPSAQRQAIPDVEAMANRQADSQVAFARSPWFRFYLDYDPVPALAHLSCPVLALFGERDLQVPAEANRAIMEEIARKGGRWTIKVIPSANHLYQAATTGSATEYARLKKEFAPGFVEAVLGWLGGRR